MKALEHSRSLEDFVVSLPPLIIDSRQFGSIQLSGWIRDDLQRAVAANYIPTSARFWVRAAKTKGEFRHWASVTTVEIVAWPGAVLTQKFAAALMDDIIALRSPGIATAFPQWTPAMDEEHLSSDVKSALSLVRSCADRRIAEAIKARPSDTCYGQSYEYRVDISSTRLFMATVRGLRIEIDPKYAEFMKRVHLAAKRLGRRVVHQMCGSCDGIDYGSDQKLEELVALDDEACGKRVIYDRTLLCWVVDDEAREARRRRLHDLAEVVRAPNDENSP